MNKNNEPPIRCDGFKTITGLVFCTEGYCKECGTHYENVKTYKGCERCISFKYKIELEKQ